ncbi:hypothetical protein ACJMK2_004895 [Sinanodonta woodiana]|uniref:C-type lectin domain-containing protein n=1 Tax=Sinanodonta woodiana TaxID=1069815 RepID=A0ABD3VR00_SINWO
MKTCILLFKLIQSFNSALYVADFHNVAADTVLGCDVGWVPGNSYCYYFENIKRVTWSQANDECSTMDAYRLRLRSGDDLNWYITSTDKLPSDGYWTALNDLPQAGSSKLGTGYWKYGSNEFPPSNVVIWNNSPDNDGVANCAGLTLQGTLEDVSCNSTQSYICETAQIQGGCKMGWLNGDTSCYWIGNSTDPQELVTWDQARQRCNDLAYKAGFIATSDLVALDTASDGTFISGELPFLTQNAILHWTGLKYKQGSWQWSTGASFSPNLVQWAVEPDNAGGLQNCATIRMNGNFSDQNCDSKHNFICMKQQDVATNDMSMGCGEWDRAGHKCYMFYTGPVSTWADARKKCLSIGADLLKVQTKDEKWWVESQMMSGLHPKIYWTGLNDQSQEGTFVWADGASSSPSLIVWNQEPNNQMGQEDCAAIYNNGVYNDKSCISKSAAACELPNQTQCPNNNWSARSVGSSVTCYLLTDFQPASKLLTWSEAIDYCASLAPDKNNVPLLLYVNDADEKAFIEHMLGGIGFNIFGFWTGLTDKGHEGVWAFYNQNMAADPSLINWDGEPDSKFGNEDCVVISWGGRYSDWKCELTTGFICEKPAPDCEMLKNAIILYVLFVCTFEIKYIQRVQSKVLCFEMIRVYLKRLLSTYSYC